MPSGPLGNRNLTTVQMKQLQQVNSPTVEQNAQLDVAFFEGADILEPHVEKNGPGLEAPPSPSAEAAEPPTSPPSADAGAAPPPDGDAPAAGAGPENSKAMSDAADPSDPP